MLHIIRWSATSLPFTKIGGFAFSMALRDDRRLVQGVFRPPAFSAGPKLNPGSNTTVDNPRYGTVVMQSEKTRENRVRRQLTRLGYRLHKTPSRSWLRAYYGPGYMITMDNTVVSGCGGREYTDQLDDVENFVTDLEA